MASPPERLGTHDCACFFMSNLAQFAYPGLKLIAQSIVRVVMKTPVLPKSIEVGRDTGRSSAQTTQRLHMFVIDPKVAERRWKRIPIVLRICPGSRDSSHIDQECDIAVRQQLGERRNRPGRMSNREKRMPQMVLSRLARETSERTAFVQRDMVRLIAFDGILRIRSRRVMGVSFVDHILRVHLDDVTTHTPGFRIPAYMVANLEFVSHVLREAFLLSAAIWPSIVAIRLNPQYPVGVSNKQLRGIVSTPASINAIFFVPGTFVPKA